MFDVFKVTFVLSDDVNDQCLYYLLKGVCCRVLKEPYKAEDCFARIIEKYAPFVESMNHHQL